MKKESDEERDFKKAKVNRENGLNISYDQEELKNFLPHLVEEIKGKKESVKIDAVDYEVEKHGSDEDDENGKKQPNLQELKDPKALDFIRRCSTKQEALEIVEFLHDRGEITEEKRNSIKNELDKENGLKNLIEKSGGFKRPGYYMRKFYLRTSEVKNNSENSPQQD